jgi:hypothetical protein
MLCHRVSFTTTRGFRSRRGCEGAGEERGRSPCFPRTGARAPVRVPGDVRGDEDVRGAREPRKLSGPWRGRRGRPRREAGLSRLRRARRGRFPRAVLTIAVSFISSSRVSSRSPASVGEGQVDRDDVGPGEQIVQAVARPWRLLRLAAASTCMPKAARLGHPGPDPPEADDPERLRRARSREASVPQRPGVLARARRAAAAR